MTSTVTRQDDKTILLKISIPWDEIKKARTEVVDEMAKHADLPGFRKGKAPKKIIEEKLDPTKVQEETIRHILPKAYVEAVNTHKIKPIIDPKIQIKPFEEGKDWEFEAQTAEEPEIKLGEYKKNVKDVTAKSKIVVPGKEEQQAKLEDVIKALLDSATIGLPRILIEHETDKLLSQSLDEIRRLGLTLDQYLASTGKTSEMLRLEAEGKATNDLKLEFVLRKVAMDEKIVVTDADLENTIGKAKTPEEKKNLETNRYLLASILRQQKTLDYLRNL